jgi:hypothetical protein
MATQREIIEQLLGALRDVLNYGVEFDDARISYISAQLDREAVTYAQRAIADAEQQLKRESEGG